MKTRAEIEANNARAHDGIRAIIAGLHVGDSLPRLDALQREFQISNEKAARLIRDALDDFGINVKAGRNGGHTRRIIAGAPPRPQRAPSDACRCGGVPMHHDCRRCLVCGARNPAFGATGL